MQVIITVAGLGQRFKYEGYQLPKPIVTVMGNPAIQYLISTMNPSWKLFFAIGTHYKNTSIEKVILSLAPECKILYVEHSSKGPLATVQAMIPLLDPKEDVAVSYCDYAMLWNPHAFEKFLEKTKADICVASYRGFHPTYLGPNTYAHLQVDGKTHEIKKLQEKQLFGDKIEEEWTSTGFYYFKTVALLEKGMKLQIRKKLSYGMEFYTSLAIQALLEEQKEKKPKKLLKVMNFEVSHFLQLGTPADVAHVEYWHKFIVKDKKSNKFPANSKDDCLFRYWCFFFKHLFQIDI